MELHQQVPLTLAMQSAATTNSNGTAADTHGTKTQLVEIVESGGGTATVQLAGSFDGTNFYNVGYQQIDNTAAPARAVTGIAVTANSRHVYQVLDPYPFLRAVISAIAGGGTITAKVYCEAI